jgi:hypothetical protein
MVYRVRPPGHDVVCPATRQVVAFADLPGPAGDHEAVRRRRSNLVEERGERADNIDPCLVRGSRLVLVAHKHLGQLALPLEL